VIFCQLLPEFNQEQVSGVDQTLTEPYRALASYSVAVFKYCKASIFKLCHLLQPGLHGALHIKLLNTSHLENQVMTKFHAMTTYLNLLRTARSYRSSASLHTTAEPIILGFSKGGVAISQLVTELSLLGSERQNPEKTKSCCFTTKPSLVITHGLLAPATASDVQGW
jgi:hypothetical protein